MLYRIYPLADSAEFYTEPRSRSKLHYHTVKEMRALYPDAKFAIIGEIGGVTRPSDNGDWLLSRDGKFPPILPRGSLKKSFEWVTGWVYQCGKKHLYRGSHGLNSRIAAARAAM